MTGSILLLLLGTVLLIAGAELLVRGASRLAAAVGISPLVVGLTVVAFGTSSPELAVTVGAALSGSADLALGNIVGSNIFNVLLILGVSALIVPLVVARQLVRIDVPFMIAVSGLLWLFCLDGRLGRLDGVVLLALLAGYLGMQLRLGRREAASPENGAPPEPGRPLWQLGLIAAGLVLLVLGSRGVVVASMAIARRLGVSELVIGLTIVAGGTSLPEVAASVMAALRGQRDIAVGNVVGSNIMNILAIGGVAALLAPGGLTVAAGATGFDLPVMTGVAVACLPIFFTGHLIARWEGALFLGYYAAYLAYLGLKATEHPLQPALRAALAGWVIPLTALTLAILAARAWRARHRH